MTFLLNVLHKDFSLIAADTQANASGEVTLTRGGSSIRINAPNVVFADYQKLFRDQSKVFVVGTAGVVADHLYANKIPDLDGVSACLECVHRHIDDRILGVDRTTLTKPRSMMENHSIWTYYDEAAGEFFTSFTAYTDRERFSRIYTPNVDGSKLIHGGTGSSKLEEAVGIDSINAFFNDIRDGFDRERCAEWITEAFQKVSEIAEGCGAKFVGMLATRENPTFLPWKPE